jgi:hypothetical protein
LRSNSANPRPALKAVGTGFGRKGKDTSVVPPAILSALPGCCDRPGIEVTRTEAASLFRVSTKTFARWEVKYDLPFKKTNARVIRYTEAMVLALLAAGKEIDREECKRLGFKPDELLKLAALLQPNPGRETVPSPDPADSVFVAGTDADRKVIAMLRHPLHGEYLRRMAEAIAG